MSRPMKRAVTPIGFVVVVRVCIRALNFHLFVFSCVVVVRQVPKQSGIAVMGAPRRAPLEREVPAVITEARSPQCHVATTTGMMKRQKDRLSCKTGSSDNRITKQVSTPRMLSQDPWKTFRDQNQNLEPIPCWKRQSIKSFGPAVLWPTAFIARVHDDRIVLPISPLLWNKILVSPKLECKSNPHDCAASDLHQNKRHPRRCELGLKND